MLTSLQFKSVNQIRIYIAMTSPIIYPNKYRMIINITFHFNHVGLIVCLSIIQGCLYPLHTLAHVFHYIHILKFVDDPHPFSLVRTIFIHVFSFTSPTLYELLSWPLPHGIYHLRFILCWIPLLMCLGFVPKEIYLRSFLPLIHLAFLLIVPRFLKS
jgi:hypothetical protein